MVALESIELSSVGREKGRCSAVVELGFEGGGG